jgi:hypothetical protein
VIAERGWFAARLGRLGHRSTLHGGIANGLLLTDEALLRSAGVLSEAWEML